MYICPVCRRRLKLSGNSYICQNRHSFDIAAKGYVNLLLTKGRNPAKAGDDPMMIKARSSFLDSGLYAPLAEATGEALRCALSGTKEPTVIDCGCGEGYYTVQYAEQLANATVYGIDISKSGIAHAASRARAAGLQNLKLAVASGFSLPFRDGFADAIISVFAPVSNDEYARVLKSKGRLIVVSPTERHLYGLKAVLYDEPYENKPNRYGLLSFTLADERRIEYTVTLENDRQVLDLFAMTPYYYKSSVEARERLVGCTPLETECGFLIQTYTKNE